MKEDAVLFQALPEQEQIDYVIYDANRLDNTLSHPIEPFTGHTWMPTARIGFSGENLGEQMVLVEDPKGTLSAKEVVSLQNHMIELFHRRFISYGEHGYIDQTITERLGAIRAELKAMVK